MKITALLLAAAAMSLAVAAIPTHASAKISCSAQKVKSNAGCRRKGGSNKYCSELMAVRYRYCLRTGCWPYRDLGCGYKKK